MCNSAHNLLGSKSTSPQKKLTNANLDWSWINSTSKSECHFKRNSLPVNTAVSNMKGSEKQDGKCILVDKMQDQNSLPLQSYTGRGKRITWLISIPIRQEHHKSNNLAYPLWSCYGLVLLSGLCENSNWNNAILSGKRRSFWLEFSQRQMPLLPTTHLNHHPIASHLTITWKK